MVILLMLLLMSVLTFGLRKGFGTWVLILGNLVRGIWKKRQKVYWLKSHGVGKYGRVLGEIFIEDTEGKQYSINETLKTEGHAYEYHGGKKKVFGD